MVGLQESHLPWYGLGLGSNPPSPLVYHRLVVGDENGHKFSFKKLLVLGTWVARVTDVAPVSVHAREVLIPSAVALSWSASSPDGCPMPLRVSRTCPACAIDLCHRVLRARYGCPLEGHFLASTMQAEA